MADDATDKINKIKGTYQEYSEDMLILRRQQRELADNFIRELEKLKIESIKKYLKETQNPI